MGGLLLILSLSILEPVPHHLKIKIGGQHLVFSFYMVLQIFLQLKQKINDFWSACKPLCLFVSQVAEVRK